MFYTMITRCRYGPSQSTKKKIEIHNLIFLTMTANVWNTGTFLATADGSILRSPAGPLIDRWMFAIHLFSLFLTIRNE